MIPGPLPTAVDECPTSLVTQESLAAVEDFWISKTLNRPPRGGGFHSWPSTLVDAWVVLTREFHTWSQMENERRTGPGRKAKG